MLIEKIPRDNRFILDGTCGSGSLLISAIKRLVRLLPQNMSGQQKHDWITKHIKGVEIEKFAAEVAQLSLLLTSIPYGNKWSIVNSDFLLYSDKINPSIIVANPPFKEDKQGERASKFIDKYLSILQDGGLMAIILPQSYFESDKCKESRKKVLEQCKIIELWYLPQGAFRTSQIASAVLFLRKKHSAIKEDSYIIKTVDIPQKEYLDFRKSGKATSVSLINVDRWKNDVKYRMVSSKCNDIIEKLLYKQTFNNVANISQGIIPGKNEDNFNSHCEEGGKWYKWLQTPLAETLAPYLIKWNSMPKYANRAYALYPGSHHRPRLNVPFEQKKILVNSVRNSGNGWRIYGAIDNEGYLVSQSFWVIYNVRVISDEVLLAIINHPISSAWINYKNRRSYIKKETILSLPIPAFTPEQQNRIKEIVNHFDLPPQSVPRELRENPSMRRCAHRLRLPKLQHIQPVFYYPESCGAGSYCSRFAIAQ